MYLPANCTNFAAVRILCVHTESCFSHEYPMFQNNHAILLVVSFKFEKPTLHPHPHTSAPKRRHLTMGNCVNTSITVVHDELQQDDNAQQQQQQQQSNHANNNSSTNRLSPLYSSLPANAQKHKVHHVYDGDTLTLGNGQRVRFLGIDTPELKERQAFAQEAKDYCKSYCENNSNGGIYICFEPNSRPEQQKDRYGRLLAWVWVCVDKKGVLTRTKPTSTNKSGTMYLCVNEGLVDAGLANVYTPGKDGKPHNFGKLVEMQRRAREAKRGLWRDFVDEMVWKTPSGGAYHRRDCRHLAKTRNPLSIRASAGMDQGLHPCRTCME